MKESLRLETQRLAKSWMQHNGRILRDYLVHDVEDPRINVQSILTRHFLIGQLFGKQFDDLMEQELRFALVINWLLGLLKKSARTSRLHAVLDALLAKEDKTEELEIPSYVSETFASLSLPNYMCDLFDWAPVETTGVPIPEYLMSTFQTIWREILAGAQPQNISVLEPACGSANDYRFIKTFGIANLINYTGFDLCDKNIRNAKQMFQDVYFEVGNVLEIHAKNGMFDFCFVHDLLEHLSVEAMEIAIAEICRVTQKKICAGFFNMHDVEEHVVRTVRNYHWNTLSLTGIKTIFESYASAVQVIHIDTFLKLRFGCGDTHNKGAYTLIINL